VTSLLLYEPRGQRVGPIGPIEMIFVYDSKTLKRKHSIDLYKTLWQNCCRGNPLTLLGLSMNKEYLVTQFVHLQHKCTQKGGIKVDCTSKVLIKLVSKNAKRYTLYPNFSQPLYTHPLDFQPVCIYGLQSIAFFKCCVKKKRTSISIL
jgi:hypothetical protein